MNILYIHGFGSQFDKSSEKVVLLETIGTVFGVTVDYTQSVETVSKLLTEAIIAYSIDLIIGTSMGGYWANRMGATSGIPFVAINPAIAPQQTLQKYIGSGMTYHDTPFYLAKQVVEQYSDFRLAGCGLILLDLGDEVLDPLKTCELLSTRFTVKVFPEGNHRFTHLEESLPIIKDFYHVSECVYGFDED
ncbi:YqiA/YcfP family alpha/beta fold hydrolase [Shewanella xiamenensis]|uniref:YqiA/YcfP family alpha/beta fold hydrolase n=1 Tax=Shewanella xiamenensis TaxID=332186 RepID=UPI0015585627|nr:YqiA/YcfP family alpha/beta fold hydrolase [Shewanella xiamenensis]